MTKLEALALVIPEGALVRKDGKLLGIALGLSQWLSTACQSGTVDEENGRVVARIFVTPEQKERVVWMVEHKPGFSLLPPAEPERDEEANRWD